MVQDGQRRLCPEHHDLGEGVGQHRSARPDRGRAHLSDLLSSAGFDDGRQLLFRLPALRKVVSRSGNGRIVKSECVMSGLWSIGVTNGHALDAAKGAQIATGIHHATRHVGTPQCRDRAIHCEALGDAPEVKADIRTVKAHMSPRQQFYIRKGRRFCSAPGAHLLPRQKPERLKP